MVDLISSAPSQVAISCRQCGRFRAEPCRMWRTIVLNLVTTESRNCGVDVGPSISQQTSENTVRVYHLAFAL